ncbi:MAG: hypothetical protein IPN07_09300 [Dehalococcoidia bacterium]|nr:hypothetical protein [Dehalococcoidia bacterium]
MPFERDADGACPALPTSETFTPSFVTAEGQENWGCLYGKIVIAKPDLTVIKTSRNAGDTSTSKPSTPARSSSGSSS